MANTNIRGHNNRISWRGPENQEVGRLGHLNGGLQATREH